MRRTSTGMPNAPSRCLRFAIRDVCIFEDPARAQNVVGVVHLGAGPMPLRVVLGTVPNRRSARARSSASVERDPERSLRSPF